jgi:hypothetical protein
VNNAESGLMNFAVVRKELNFNTMEDIKPNVPESKYAPLSYDIFKEMSKELEGVKSFLPEHLMGKFWTWCNTIRGERTNQPCGCKSSAKHWAGCVDTLRQFVRERSE